MILNYIDTILSTFNTYFDDINIITHVSNNYQYMDPHLFKVVFDKYNNRKSL